jgi:acetylornithine deacetylase/succinyl-diaminopimelate desuccinylase-like protein
MPGRLGPAPAASQTTRTSLVRRTPGADVLAAAQRDARSLSTVLLTEQQKVEAVTTLIRILRIANPSTMEQDIRADLMRTFQSFNAREIRCQCTNTLIPIRPDLEGHLMRAEKSNETARRVLENARQPMPPNNLMLGIPATADFIDQPAVVLNAHMDSAFHVQPEALDYDERAKELFSNHISAFGADDKAGVAIIVQALEALKANYWDKGFGHRKMVLLFTAQEELGTRGSTHLGTSHQDLFGNVLVSLCFDAPLNYQPAWVGHAFVFAIPKDEAVKAPYRQIAEYVAELSRAKGLSYYPITESNRYDGADYAHFPPNAHSINLTSGFSGVHKREQLKLQDFVNHVELLMHILLRMDGHEPVLRR